MPIELVVAIPTYRRPATLAPNLAMVTSQARDLVELGGEQVNTRVLVVDNDPDRSAAQVVAEAGADYVPEPEPGIVAARNRALDEASSADLLVFIDDDEIPQPGWLAELAQTWERYRPDAVWGRVRSVFEGPLDPWVAAGEFFTRARRETGTPMLVAACGSLLLDLRRVRELAVRFDPQMRLGGGEDTLFTRMLVSRGGKIVWSDESVADDVVPASRANRKWVLARALSHGNAAARVEVILAGKGLGRLAAHVRCVAGGIARFLAGSARRLAGLVRRSLRDQARGARTAYRGIGMTAGGLGLAYQEYARADGRRARWRRI